MNSRKISVYGFLSVICMCVFLTILGCSTKHYATNTKKNERQKDRRDPIYKKLFKDTTKLHTERGVITVHRYKEKIYFEMPVDLLGREFLLKSVVSKSSNLNFAGMEGVQPRYFTVDRTDTLVLYKERVNNVVYNDRDSAQNEAMKLSKGEPVFKTFRLEGYTRDSLNILYDVTDFYRFDNKDIIDLKDMPYAPLIIISAVKPHKETSFFNGIRVYDNAVMVENTFSATLELSLLGFYKFPEKPSLTLQFATYMVLLPEQKMPARVANQNVGTGIVPFYDYRPLVDVKWKYYVTRHRMEKDKELVFYIDTLINPAWRVAIESAAGEWNKAFDRIGLGSPLKIRPYVRDTAFSADDPTKNIIFLSNSRAGTMKPANIVDPRTGEIICSHISVSREAVSAIRQVGVLQLAAVDERFRTYLTPEDAVCEILKGIALRSFGYALGLSANYAGSYAYTPQQIRSAEFTRANGFTASVMDDVLCNTLAQPGDKEKGVSLVIDRVGTADALALRYLYGDFGNENDEEEKLKAYVRKHDGDPRYLYIGEHSIAPSDPRGQTNDLGNDPVVFLKNRTANMKYLVNECVDWFDEDSVPDSFKSSLLALILQEYYGSVLGTPLSYIGGVYINEVNQLSSLPPYSVVDKSLQKNVIKVLLASYEDMDWLNANRSLLRMGGVDANVIEYINRQGMPVKSLMQRLKYLSFGLPETEMNSYTHEEYLSDIETYLFSDVIKGKPMPEGKQMQLPDYFSALISLSPSLTEMDKARRSSGKKLVDEEAFARMLYKDDVARFLAQSLDDETSVRKLYKIPYYSADDLAPLVFKALGRARAMLERSKKQHPDPIYRNKMDFYLLQIKEIMEPSRKD